ncbi:hypothetical protein B0H16DRAFT_1356329 [Mycena metata]|uniref:F-box domain-containing protein n=1 Tax=Mycena metata TaxID=1033252 RepID=A0AAD7P1R4_9AGAR|nr:hypothetical protein B0H16DRAFT_1356329 [Mycena metata]
MDHLPVELLANIFVLGAADQLEDSPFLLRPDEDHCLASSVTDFQLLVSHVCQHWRQVSLRISCLWTSLHFREPAHIARAEAFLARVSPNHSLDILVDTVSVEDHIPGVTLCRDEMHTIFALITPHVARWRAFHLKVRANECKLIARHALSTCGPAPRLETLQLYHFEDFRTSQNLYIATYRAPVVIFDNVLPALKNVSLIGVNLPWAHAPYLQHLHALELALHTDSIRPPYDAWAAMLCRSTSLRRLLLHYSGPRAADDHNTRICVPALEELSLTDLDPEHLARLLYTLELPRLRTLTLDLPDQDYAQDYTGVVEMIAGVPTVAVSAGASTNAFPAAKLPIAALHTLRITALECAPAALGAVLRRLTSLRVLELDFTRIRSPSAICDVLLETVAPSSDANADSEEIAKCDCAKSRRVPVLPRLEEARLFGLAGERVRALLTFRRRFAEGCRGDCAEVEGETEDSEYPPSSASSSCSSRSSEVGATRAPVAAVASEASGENAKLHEHGRAAMPRFVVRYSSHQRGKDAVLEQLVRQGRVELVEEEREDEYVDAGEDSSEDEDAAEGEDGGGE